MTHTPPIPVSPNEISPTWLTTVLREASVLERGTVVALDWEPIGEEQGFTGVVARLHLEYADRGHEDTAPPSLVAKFPTAERRVPSAYRGVQEADAVAARRHYERCAREAHFYREIGPHSRLWVPHPYYAAADDETGSVVLLLEDLVAARPGDVLAGCSSAEATLVLEAMAPIHARWWGQLSPGALPWLPRWGADAAARQERYARQVGPFLERFGAQLPPPVHDLVDRLRTHYASVLFALGQAPAAVLHADLHLDNVMFNPPGTASPAVVLDWQGVSRGAAAVDVALFVFGSLAVGERRVAEQDLFCCYHALLVEHGVRGYPLQRLHDDSRLALLWQLAGTVGWLASVDPDRLMGRERALADAAIRDGRLVSALLDHAVGHRIDTI